MAEINRFSVHLGIPAISADAPARSQATSFQNTVGTRFTVAVPNKEVLTQQFAGLGGEAKPCVVSFAGALTSFSSDSFAARLPFPSPLISPFRDAPKFSRIRTHKGETQARGCKVGSGTAALPSFPAKLGSSERVRLPS